MSSKATAATANGDNGLSIPVPLRENDQGLWRVVGTRITLGLVVDCFERGWSPEEIAARYDSLKLTDIYRVISFYLTEPDRVRAMLVREGELAVENDRLIAADTRSTEWRRELLARWAARQQELQPV